MSIINLKQYDDSTHVVKSEESMCLLRPTYNTESDGGRNVLSLLYVQKFHHPVISIMPGIGG